MNIFHPQTPFRLDSGDQLKDIKIAYNTFGEVNQDKTNVIWVFHAISANADVMEWWPGLFGAGHLFDPEKYFIICANTIGSPYGSSRPQDLSFPQFTVRDIVRSQLELAHHLGIDSIHTAIGGSFGGFQAMEFAYQFDGKIENLILLACSAKESAWGIAIHESQRLAMKSDPTFGEKGGGGAGMKAARSMAMLTYRTSDAFIAQQSDEDDTTDNFKASSYIQYQGDKFVNRFDALCYYYLTKCLDTHNIGRGRGGIEQALAKINIPTLVIGIKSDTLNPVRFQKQMVEYLPDAQYEEITSDYGHDGFLIEVEKITEIINNFNKAHSLNNDTAKRTILKFGGSSLASPESMRHVCNIITEESKEGPIAVIVSARGKSTDQLEQLFSLAQAGQPYDSFLEKFQNYQVASGFEDSVRPMLQELEQVLLAISLLQTDDEFARDRVLSYGELISAAVVVAQLKKTGLDAKVLDARELIFTNKLLQEFEVDIEKSRLATSHAFNNLPHHTIPVIPGFIASSEKNKTVTLGRNGSNYSATLIGSFIHAREIQNWTDVDGVYTTNPNLVPEACLIEELTYREANEMANFGTHLLHPKTIIPLMQSNVPLRIKNTNNPKSPGTLIHKGSDKKGMRAVTLIDDVALITIMGTGMLNQIGIDARIFNILSREKINIRMISQASSERGIGFVVDRDNARRTEYLLNEEFQDELRLNNISYITANRHVGIIAILGRHNYSLEKAIKALRKNKIWMHLISNSISGEHISLVVDNRHLNKALQLVHAEVMRQLPDENNIV